MQITSLLPIIKADYPNISFIQGDNFAWSPHEKSVTYNDSEEHAAWALLHEVAHADLGHKHYQSDVALLKLEVNAWVRAREIAKNYDITIDEDHIQDCLDTYRDWLHKRASCPECNVVSLQQKTGVYKCFNCQSQWRVPSSPLCKVVRVRL
jgi:hypothetical protein